MADAVNTPNFEQTLGLARESFRAGRTGEAAALCQQLLATHPPHHEVLHLLGIIHLQNGAYDAAAESIVAAIKHSPAVADYYLNLAICRRRQGMPEAAIECCRAAVRLRPDDWGAFHSLGVALIEQGRPSEAAEAWVRAASLRPDAPEPLLNLGRLFLEQDQLTAAIEYLSLAARLRPDAPDLQYVLATTYQKVRQTDLALACVDRAIALRPDFAEAHYVRGQILGERGQLEDTITSWRAACAYKPTEPIWHSNLLFALNYVQTDAAELKEEHLVWARRHAAPLYPYAASNDREDLNPGRQLRIGYCSADFCGHAVATFLEPVLASHTDRVEVFCYSEVQKPDEMTGRIMRHADTYRMVADLSDDALAETIRRDRIDILVDLAGHTAGNRLLVFARKPAPVQVTYFGYQYTTGLATMDYRLTDAWCDPPGVTDHHYVEELVRLPRTHAVYGPPAYADEVSDSPCLKNGHVTFGCLHRAVKVRPETVSVWARVLRQVPDSKLVLRGHPDPRGNEQLFALFARNGVDPMRVRLVPTQVAAGYLRTFHQIDVVLDTFPYSGCTTTCDALWMGVPVVNFAGERYASRMGTTMLAQVGLTDLIAYSEDEYAGIATRLAGARERLSHLRHTMRERLRRSPLLNFVGFTLELEAAYRAMWTRFCQHRTRGRRP